MFYHKMYSHSYESIFTMQTDEGWRPRYCDGSRPIAIPLQWSSGIASGRSNLDPRSGQTYVINTGCDSSTAKHSATRVSATGPLRLPYKRMSKELYVWHVFEPSVLMYTIVRFMLVLHQSRLLLLPPPPKQMK